MLGCQMAGMVASLVPHGIEVIAELAHLARQLARRRKPPARQLADAVWAAMGRDPDILARRFADRWLARVHGRGLGGRVVPRAGRGRGELPFNLDRRLSRGPTLAGSLTVVKSLAWRGGSVAAGAEAGR